MAKSLSKVEQAVLTSGKGDVEPLKIFRSQTRVDTGRWWRRSVLCLAVYPGEIAVFAASRRRYFCHLELADLTESYYSHRTGELILAPAEECRFKQIKMNPSEALEILSMLSLEAE